MKTTKAAKADRRDPRAVQRAVKRGKRRDDLRLTALGGSMDRALMDAILDGARSIDLEAPFADLAPRILPVVKRVWHPYPPETQLVQVTLPPGIPIGFCIDMGPAFTHVTRQLLDTWDVDLPTLLTTSLDNLRALTRVEPPVIQRFTHDGVDVVAIQGQGWGSALLLVPDVLGPIVGHLPRLLMTPVRNAVISLPEDVDPEIAKLLWSAMADGAHDVLDVDPLLWTGSDIAAIREEQALRLPD